MTTELWAALIGGVVLLLTNSAAAIKLWGEVQKTKADRAEVGAKRDADSQAMRDSLLKLQFEVTSLKDTSVLHAEHIEDLNKQSATLNTTLAQVLVKLDNIFETLKELKERE